MSFKSWNKTTLSDMMDIIGGGTPKTTIEEYWNGDINWISVKDFNGDSKYILDTEKTITKLGLDKSSTKLLEKDDIIISARGTVGALSMISKPMAFNQSCYGLRAKSHVNSDFLFYLLKNSIIILQNNTHGSVFSTITRNTFDTIEVVVPDIREQKAIADILSSLDDKVELNNQMNETLEEMAQALFKRWFVDFEFPNEEGQPYKSSGGEMIESELGMIPKGWKCVTLDNIISTISIKHNFNKEELIFLNTSDVLNGEVLHSNYTSVKGLPGQAKKSIQKDDILYSEIRPQNKRFAYVDFDASDYVVSTKLMVLRSKGVLHPKLIYLFLTNNKIIENLQMIAESRSGTFPQITFKELSNMKINVPLIENLNAFENSLVSLINKIFENKKENKRLIELRDSLLPKLMSGEIRVSDLEG